MMRTTREDRASLGGRTSGLARGLGAGLTLALALTVGACGADVDAEAGEDALVEGVPGPGAEGTAEDERENGTDAPTREGSPAGTPPGGGSASGESSGAGAASRSQDVTGRVAVVGAEPMTMVVVQTEEGAQVELVGPLAPDLRRLQGARVRVRGRAGTGMLPRGRAVEVTGYEVLDIEGERPHVGTLIRLDGSLALKSGAGELRIEGAPADLGQHVGARIWIVGRASGGGLRLQSYGIIRPAG